LKRRIGVVTGYSWRRVEDNLVYAVRPESVGLLVINLRTTATNCGSQDGSTGRDYAFG